MKEMDCMGFAFDAFDKSSLSLKHVKYTGIKKGRSLQCCLILIAWFIFNEVSVLSKLQSIQKYLISHPITQTRNQNSHCVSATKYIALEKESSLSTFITYSLHKCLCVCYLMKIAHYSQWCSQPSMSGEAKWKNLPNFAFSSWFFLLFLIFSLFSLIFPSFPLFPNLWQVFHGGGGTLPLCPWLCYWLFYDKCLRNLVSIAGRTHCNMTMWFCYLLKIVAYLSLIM